MTLEHLYFWFHAMFIRKLKGKEWPLHICVIFSCLGGFKFFSNHNDFMAYGHQNNKFDEWHTLGKFKKLININGV